LGAELPPTLVATKAARYLEGFSGLPRMRPLNGSLFAPACVLRVNLATVRKQRTVRGFPAGVRRHMAFVVITIVTVAGWSSRNEKTVPRLGAAAAVRPSSGVDRRATANTAFVSASIEIVGRVLAPPGLVIVVETPKPDGEVPGGADGDTGYS
jgi:hypothetical protein